MPFSGADCQTVTRQCSPVLKISKFIVSFNLSGTITERNPSEKNRLFLIRKQNCIHKSRVIAVNDLPTFSDSSY